MRLIAGTLAAALLAAPAAAEPDLISAGPLADLAADQRQVERRIERGFERTREGFRNVANGFDRVEREFRTGVRRDLSIAAIAALPQQPDGWSIAGGLAFSTDKSAPGGAVALAWTRDRYSFRLAVAGPDPMIALGFAVGF